MTIEKLKERIEEIISQLRIEEIISQFECCYCSGCCIDGFALFEDSDRIESDTLFGGRIVSICLRRLLKTIAYALNDEDAVANYIRAGYFGDVDSLCGDFDTFRKVLKMIDEITENENSHSMEIE